MPTGNAKQAITCTPRYLPREEWEAAARIAAAIEPSNEPPGTRPPARESEEPRLAVVRQKRWNRVTGVRLTVGFLDSPPLDLRARILLHMNAWSATANVQFVETAGDAQVRIARQTPDTAPPGQAGYWSYLGTDILMIPRTEPTMNLQGFTMDTPDSEFFRVVRHETGHTLGFPHEHMRLELVQRLDRDRVIAYYMQTQGWSEQTVIDQVLTPLSESSLLGTLHADQDSIMCYQIPGFLTKDGQPIRGGTDIDALDAQFAATIYPKR